MFHYYSIIPGVKQFILTGSDGIVSHGGYLHSNLSVRMSKDPAFAGYEPINKFRATARIQ